MSCLERKRRRLQALVSVFADKPDRQVVVKAVEASLGLGGLALCADVKALKQEVEPPERPEDRQALAELRGRLEDVSQLHALGKYQAAEPLLEELAPRVEALGFPPLQAQFWYYDALIRRFLGRYAEAEPILRAAIQMALPWGMKQLAAEVGAEATYLVGYLLGRHAAGLIYGYYTEGLTRGRGDDLEARALQTLATLYYAQGESDKAEELNQRSLRIREKALGPDHPHVALSLTNLANVYFDQGKYAEAERLHKRALAIWKRHSPPNTAWPLVGLAETYENEHRLTEALSLLERARRIRDEAKVAPKERAVVAFAFARVYWALGKERVRARSFAQEALTLYQTAGQGADKERLEATRWLAEHQ